MTRGGCNEANRTCVINQRVRHTFYYWVCYVLRIVIPSRGCVRGIHRAAWESRPPVCGLPPLNCVDGEREGVYSKGQERSQSPSVMDCFTFPQPFSSSSLTLLYITLEFNVYSLPRLCSASFVRSESTIMYMFTFLFTLNSNCAATSPQDVCIGFYINLHWASAPGIICLRKTTAIILTRAHIVVTREGGCWSREGARGFRGVERAHSVYTTLLLLCALELSGSFRVEYREGGGGCGFCHSSNRVRHLHASNTHTISIIYFVWRVEFMPSCGWLWQRVIQRQIVWYIFYGKLGYLSDSTE